MPTYEYRCVTCDLRFEVERRMGTLREELCPECGSTSKRVFSPVGVAFKGSGFHNTDYRERPKAETKPSEAPSKCDAAGAGGACSGCPAASA